MGQSMIATNPQSHCIEKAYQGLKRNESRRPVYHERRRLRLPAESESVKWIDGPSDPMTRKSKTGMYPHAAAGVQQWYAHRDLGLLLHSKVCLARDYFLLQ